MAQTKRITVTSTEDQLTQIDALTESGVTPSLSGFVRRAVELALADETEPPGPLNRGGGS